MGMHLIMILLPASIVPLCFCGTYKAEEIFPKNYNDGSCRSFILVILVNPYADWLICSIQNDAKT